MTFNQTVAGSNPAVLMNSFIHNYYHVSNLSLQINFSWFLFYQRFYNNLPSKFLALRVMYPFFFKKPSKTPTLKPYFNKVESKISAPNVSVLAADKNSTDKLFNLEYRWSLFLMYFQFMDNRRTNFFSPHANFKNMFLFDSTKTTVFFNYSRLYMRWTHTYNLLINIFFRELTPVLFATKMFRKEVTAFNWSLDVLDQGLFKHSSPYFFLKDCNYGDQGRYVFSELERAGLNVSFVTDIKYHEKNVYFLKRFNSYTIGIVPFNMNPWLVSYCIPIATNNIIIEFFFFKLISFIRQFVATQQYTRTRQLWEAL